MRNWQVQVLAWSGPLFIPPRWPHRLARRRSGRPQCATPAIPAIWLITASRFRLDRRRGPDRRGPDRHRPDRRLQRFKLFGTIHRPLRDDSSHIHAPAETILFVEDEALVRMDMAEFLRECGYRVHEAANANEAIEALQSKFAVDLVFTDINLGEGMNGLELAGWTLSNRPGVKVLVTTGTSRVEVPPKSLISAGEALYGPRSAGSGEAGAGEASRRRRLVVVDCFRTRIAAQNAHLYALSLSAMVAGPVSQHRRSCVASVWRRERCIVCSTIVLRTTTRRLLESCEDAILSKDLDGVITSWNRGAQRLFGYAAEEVVGRSVTILIPSDRENEEPMILQRIRRGERIEHYETVRRRKDGSLVDISLTVSPIRDPAGKVVGASKIARDITERRRAQEQRELLLREMNHQIKNLFALASSVVSLSGRSAHSVEELMTSAQEQLSALARAHELTLSRGPSTLHRSPCRPHCIPLFGQSSRLTNTFATQMQNDLKSLGRTLRFPVRQSRALR